MNANDQGEDQLASQLAAWDEALAEGATPNPGDTDDDLSPELRARLDRGLECMKLLHEARPRRQRDDVSFTRTHEPFPPTALESTRLEGETPASSHDAASENTILGRFQIRRELGRGGFGVVFLAYDPQLNREVALKVPRVDALVAPELRLRFQQEARAAAGLDHPNIVPVYEAGEVGPITYIASAYCPGMTLAAWIKQCSEPVPFATAAGLTATLADAVQHAHSRGVVHRDLKPANVLLVAGRLVAGRLVAGGLVAGGLVADTDAHPAPATSLPAYQPPVPKITDFGLAKLMDTEVTGPNTKTGAVLGTPSYMAPEQASGKTGELGPAVDVYALGATLYELLTGWPPFRGESDIDTLLQVQYDEPLPPGRLRPKLTRDLETICLKCLQKEPRLRYASARELGEDLQRFLRKEPIHARPVGIVGRTWRWCRRRPAVAGLVAALAAVFIVGVTGIIWQWQNAVAGWNHADAGWTQASLERDQVDLRRQEAEGAFRRGLQTLDSFLSQITEEAPVRGSVLLRRDVLENLLAYYAEFLLQWRDRPEFQLEVARSYARMGWIRDQLGDQAGSSLAYQEACQRAEPLLAVEPIPVEAGIWAGRAYSNLAGVQVALGLPEDAGNSYRRALGILHRTAAAPTATVEAKHLRAGTIRNYAAFLHNRGKRDEGYQLFQEAVRLLEELVRSYPDDEGCQGSLGFAYRGVGHHHKSVNAHKEARAAYEKAVAIHQTLHERKPRHHFRRRDLASAQFELGVCLMIAQQYADAAVSLTKACTLWERLAGDFPEILDYQGELAWAYNHFGMLDKNARRWEAGSQRHQQATEIYERLLKQLPNHLDYRAKLGGNLHNHALCLKGARKLDEALGLFDQAVQQQNQVLAKAPAHPLARPFLGNHHAEKARVLIPLGRREEAVAALHAIDQLHPNDPLYQYDIAGQFANLASTVGKGPAASEDADNTERLGYIDQSLLHLGKSLARGYKNIKQLKEDRRLDPLRPREDFQKLLAELENAQKK